MIGEEALGQLAIAEAVPSAGEVPSARFDWFATVLSQYANSPVLLALIEGFADCLDPAANYDAFFKLVFNVDTAVGYGLDVWGRIVGVSRVLRLPAPGDYFGFSESADAHSFNEGIFYGGATLTSNFALSDDAYRRLILAKALANISDGSIPAINQILINLFAASYGNCYVTDGENMTMTYTFGATLTPVDFAIVAQSGVLPRPVGVTATIVQL
jgi:hypothetical protein